MKLRDCTPGKAIYHKYDFYAIITRQTKTSNITGKLMIRVIRTNGSEFWAYLESMINMEMVEIIP